MVIFGIKNSYFKYMVIFMEVVFLVNNRKNGKKEKMMKIY